ncbi:MAG: prepilin peptidase, partial [Methanobacteriota archaeon]
MKWSILQHLLLPAIGTSILHLCNGAKCTNFSTNFKLYEIIGSFLLGIILGSFLNTCIYRLSRGMSLWNPKRSFCPCCKQFLLWWHNMPLLSFLILSGKCYYCQNKISYQYPV